MIGPAGLAAAARRARKPSVNLTREASRANMEALIAAGETGEPGNVVGSAAAATGSASMKRELAKLGMEPVQ